MIPFAKRKDQPKTPIYDKRGFVPSVLSRRIIKQPCPIAGRRGFVIGKKERFLIYSIYSNHPIYRPLKANGLKKNRGAL